MHATITRVHTEKQVCAYTVTDCHIMSGMIKFPCVIAYSIFRSTFELWFAADCVRSIRTILELLPSMVI